MHRATAGAGVRQSWSGVDFCEIAAGSHEIVQIALDCTGLQPQIQTDLVLEWYVTVM